MIKNVSIAMAVYNGERFIHKQIESILVQLDHDDELVISYDKSSDRTWEIIKEYEKNNQNIHVFENNDPGVFGNFENAIRNCTGDLIFISDQDDIWCKDKLQEVKACIERNKADMVIHNGYSIDTDDNVISESFFDIYGIRKGVLRNFSKPRYSGCCTAFTKEFKEIVLPIPRNVGAYDHWLGMVGEVMGKLVFLDKPLILHRLHDNNVTPKSQRPLSVIIAARFNLLYNLIQRKHLIKSKNNGHK